jgi:hypothetical protein
MLESPVPPSETFTGLSRVTVIVFPEPEVVMPSPPSISKLFANGMAVPESVVKEVGICGFADSISRIPAWLIN